MRRTIIVVTTVLLAVSVHLATVGFWMRSEVVRGDAFTATALESFTLPGSHEAIGEIVADKVVEEYPVLTFVRSNLASLLGSMLATDPFEPVLVVIAEDVHDRLYGGVHAAVIIDLGEYEGVILESLEASAPGLVSLLPSGVFRQYTLFDADEIPDLAADADRIWAVTVFSVISAVAAMALLVVMARPWTTSVIAIGIALMLASLVTLVVKPLASGVMRVTIADEAYRVLAVNFFEVSSQSLMVSSGVIGAVGLVLASVGLGGWLRQRGGNASA